MQNDFKRPAVLFVLVVAGLLLVNVASALAISAPIHISGTAGEGVFIRSGPSTSDTRVGWMPEGSSPDYICFVWGQDINGVPIWFNVNYGGVIGYYASFYDDSSYHSNEELTAKYGVPLCGPVPTAAPPLAPSPPASSSPPATPQSSPLAIYFSPYDPGAKGGQFEVNDGATKTLYIKEWESHCEERGLDDPGLPYHVAMGAAPGRAIKTLAGWSKGRIGVLSYLATAKKPELEQLNYVLLIDPGYYSQMTCDRSRKGGAAIVRWLQANTKAHLVIISSTEITQQDNSKGIQKSYFSSLRAADRSLSSRVLVCNYSLPNDGREKGHRTAFWTSRYWIQHEIDSYRAACPRLSLNGSTWTATDGWHPINN